MADTVGGAIYLLCKSLFLTRLEEEKLTMHQEAKGSVRNDLVL